MSAEADLQTLLAANTAIAALVDGHIAQDRAEQEWGRPFVIYIRSDTDKQRALDGTIVATKVLMDVQIWADTRLEADEIADAVSAVIEAGNNGDVVGQATAYDPELNCEATLLTVEWWE